ncbi:hypothetical protein Tco_1158498 [Tanacetum coccineum]
MQANDGLSKKLALLESVHSNFLDRERELMDRLKDVEKERDDWRQTDSKQIVDSYCLPVDALIKVSPDVPLPTNDLDGSSTQNADGGSTKLNNDAPLA